jgi:hypothetical protein
MDPLEDDLLGGEERWLPTEPAGLVLAAAAIRREAPDARAESRQAAQRLYDAVNALMRKGNR